MEKLLDELHRAGIRLRLVRGDLQVMAPSETLTEPLRQALRLHKAQLLELLASSSDPADALPAEASSDQGDPSRPFPLTELQQAYWLGRGKAGADGAIASHFYIEIDSQGLDPARLNQALCRLVERHEMLRAVVGTDGMQRVLAEVPRYAMPVTDCREATVDGQAETLEATRQALSHQVMQPDRWPLFDIRATLLPAGRLRLHLSLDLLMFDGGSFSVFLREWARFYDEPEWEAPALERTFRDHVLAEEAAKSSAAHGRAQSYWMARVGSLPPAPELPLRVPAPAGASARFGRREAVLPAARWALLKARASSQGLTPSCLLLAAYAQVLARWSASAHFTVNVVTSRRPVLAGMAHLIGNFASPLLHEVDLRGAPQSFLDFAGTLQRRFMADVEHGRFGGVSVMREWTRRRGETAQVAMPVVFSSGLASSGSAAPWIPERLGQPVHGVSQTSQVWLDHRVVEGRGELRYHWDAAEALFEPGVLDAMFDAYRGFVEQLAEDDDAWTRLEPVLLPEAMRRRREQAADTALQVSMQRLHAGFVAQARRRPDALALVSEGRVLSYGELLAESLAVADVLLQAGLRAEQPVAVLMRKGWAQVVAAYGVLLAGGAYLPVDADLPARRQIELLQLAGVGQVLVQPGGSPAAVAQAGRVVHEVWPGRKGALAPVHLRSLTGGLGALAYVIFTSGTTGVPKGVMIEHRGAVNTVQHINRLYEVGPQDRLLGVSALSFDLSVYDIFGLHAAGGALVLPDHERRLDPAHWRALMEEFGVTRWNSAPQLMSMLLDSGAPAAAACSALRSVMLSGDFIPLDLPQRIRSHYPTAEVISLGGATEASIWSIHHRVDTVRPEWPSIPYGRPLPNQTVQVLDAQLRPTPDQVRGRIFIGGSGLARGYWGDAARTAASFITHPDSGERLYDTGDLGRYAADGEVFILGRADGQVKIRGHRVETGEIEAVLRSHPAARRVVVTAAGGPAGSRRLAAFVEPAGELGHGGRATAVRQFKDHLAERLPEYMVPRHVLLVERMPVSANGKLDTQALARLLDEADVADSAVHAAPRTAAERAVLEVWQRVMPLAGIGVFDNFFELGGDSVLATQLLRELNDGLFTRLEIHDLFENITIASLARLLERQQAEPTRGGPAAPGLASADALAADVAAARAAVARLPAPAGALAGRRTVFLTGATGWVGSHLLNELLCSTDLRVVCLVRAASDEEARARLLGGLVAGGWGLQPSHHARLSVLRGDLRQARFGLPADTWAGLCGDVDQIFHLAASVGVLQGYEVHRHHNVRPLDSLLELALSGAAKPVVTLSPMAVNRRVIEGRLDVLAQECVHDNPEGLRTGYAQSKWVAEQVLWSAAGHGLPVRIYRTSHALPSVDSARSKPGDTYATVLQLASRVDVVPDWPGAMYNGMPVDRLCELLLQDALALAGTSAVVHLEHCTPDTVQDIVSGLVRTRLGTDPVRVALADWQRACLAEVDALPETQQALARVLFTAGVQPAPIEHMFSRHRVEMDHAGKALGLGRLSHLTSSAYWCRAVSGTTAVREPGIVEAGQEG